MADIMTEYAGLSTAIANGLPLQRSQLRWEAGRTWDMAVPVYDMRNEAALRLLCPPAQNSVTLDVVRAGLDEIDRSCIVVRHYDHGDCWHLFTRDEAETCMRAVMFDQQHGWWVASIAGVIMRDDHGGRFDNDAVTRHITKPMREAMAREIISRMAETLWLLILLARNRPAVIERASTGLHRSLSAARVRRGQPALSLVRELSVDALRVVYDGRGTVGTTHGGLSPRPHAVRAHTRVLRSPVKRGPNRGETVITVAAYTTGDFVGPSYYKIEP